MYRMKYLKVNCVLINTHLLDCQNSHKFMQNKYRKKISRDYHILVINFFPRIFFRGNIFFFCIVQSTAIMDTRFSNVTLNPKNTHEYYSMTQEKIIINSLSKCQEYSELKMRVLIMHIYDIWCDFETRLH